MTQTIERHKGQSGPYSFDGLRRQGIELLQQVSGDIWTDYNLHDPGVTILEQLCYGLTDLINRAQFDVEDYLTDEDGNIDFESLALYSAEEVFPCRATTIADYRKIILDSVPELDGLMMKRAQKGGLYHIDLHLRPGHKKQAVIEKVRKAYRAHRNLCEDVESISVVEEVECELVAEVDITSAKEPAEILANIYFKALKSIRPGAPFRSYEEVLSGGMTLEEIFDGPFTLHGRLDDGELEAEGRSIQVLDVFSAIRSVEGVAQIKTLYFQMGEREVRDNLTSAAPEASIRLRIPDRERDLKVILFTGGKRVSVNLKDVLNKLNELDFKDQALRHCEQDLSSLYRRPKGSYRDLEQYFSIQHQFPNAYGINAFGIPAFAEPEVKARAVQLKSYLLIFEQLMANYSSNLHNIPKLFSTESDGPTAFFQALDNSAVPHVEPIYNLHEAPKNGVGSQVEKLLGPLVSGYDKAAERRSRFLDYLLALHGEEFTQSYLRTFYPPEEMKEAVNTNKAELLKGLVKAGRDRGGAIDSGQNPWSRENVSGLKLKVSLQLGLKYHHNRSLTAAVRRGGVKMLSNESYSRLREGSVELKLVGLDGIDSEIKKKFRRVPEDRSVGELGMKELRRNIAEIVPLRSNVLCPALLRHGVKRSSYRIGRLSSEDNYLVAFKHGGEGPWSYLGAYEDRDKAVRAVNSLCRFLAHLNIESEGFHLVEHILLRTRNEPMDESFHCFRVSVILPTWPARFNDSKFRGMAESSIRSNCPAHLVPDFHWLDFEKMFEFEILYKKWMEQLCNEEGEPEDLDLHSNALSDFLRDKTKGS